MSKPTIAIIGGSQEATFKKIGSKLGCNILFHPGKAKKSGSKKEFQTIIKKSDCVVVLLGACGHVTMDIVKDICKTTGTQLVFQNGFGASGAISAGLDELNTPIAS